MCLLTNNSLVKVATKPIKCYKLVKRVRFNLYYTPYRNHVIDEAFINGSLPFVAEGILEPHENTRYNSKHYHGVNVSNVFNDHRYSFSEGLIHCFSNKKEALMTLDNCFFQKRVVYEVEIPAGAKYVKGKFGDDPCLNSKLNDFDSIGATEIIFKKEVTSNGN